MAEEKIYTIPLGKAYDYTRTKRAKRAVSLVQQFVARHSKVESENVKISGALNSALWARGIQKPPRRIRIKVVKEGEVAHAYLADEKIPKNEEEKKKPEEAQQAEKEEAKEENKK